MYCDPCRGVEMKWNDRDIRLRIGLQCGIDKMWIREKSTCSSISVTIKKQLLNNYNYLTKDLATLPQGAMSTIDADLQFGNFKTNAFMLS